MDAVQDISRFLAPHQQLGGIDLCLPRFAGNDGRLWGAGGAEADRFCYPARAFAERDVRSAMHVVRLLSNVPNAAGPWEFPLPEQFPGREPLKSVSIVFGSRSNEALEWVEEKGRLADLVRFEFGAVWRIIGQDGQQFSLRDPSRLDRAAYAASTDYAVVARTTAQTGGSVFLIAGLGGRATEGGGLFLAEHWRALHDRFGDQDFAVILRFEPPVDPSRSEPVAWYSQQSPMPSTGIRRSDLPA